MTSSLWLVSEKLFCIYNLHQLTFLLESSVVSVLVILGDYSDFYSISHERRERLAAIFQGRDIHMV
jgi:hypothetical protein